MLHNLNILRRSIMELISLEEFDKLSLEEMKEYMISLVNELSDEQAKELYEEIMADDQLREIALRNK